MSSSEQTERGMRISVSNIGGIEETQATFEPGVTVLPGRNATNRTSLLQAIMAGLGSNDVSLKTDAKEGAVELEIDDEQYSRTLTREGNHVSFDGDPYLDDPELADLFAFLLESNEARRAVVRDDDLHELIMRPVDTEEIQAEIESLTDEKRRLDEQLRDIDDLRQELPNLKQQLGAIEDEIEEQEAKLEAKETEIESLDADIEESREEKNKLDDKFDELGSKRSKLEETRAEIERKQESIDSLTQRLDELESEKSDMPEAPMGEVHEIESTVDQLRNEIQTVNGTINEIQTIIQFNEEKLTEANGEIAEALGVADTSADSVTDRLVEDEETVCWTCGSEVEESSIETTLDRLRELNQEKRDRRAELNDQIDELEEEKYVYQEKQRQREQIERELESVREKIQQREERVAALREQQEELGDEITELEEAVENLESEEYSEILNLHKEANQIEFELGRKNQERESIEGEITRIESRVEKRDDLAEERESIQESLQDLRTKIDRIEEQAVEQFNEHMDAVLNIMEFENIDRIWIERTEEQVRKGRQKVTETVFDLHVVRSTSDGVTYEDQIDNLSESERETTGLIFALAGYLVHNVYEQMPFILLDSLEAIDSDRIAALVEYFSEYTDYIIVALLPEDASAIDPEQDRLAEI